MRFIIVLLAVSALLAAASFRSPVASLSVSSPAFTNNAPVPIRYTCAGQEFSPPLNIANIPQNAKSLAIIVYDPQGIEMHTKPVATAAKTSKGRKRAKKPLATHTAVTKTCDSAGNCYVYWMVWNIDVNDSNIPENFKNDEEGLNSAAQVGYKGLCAASGTHYYHFKVFALDTKLNIDKKSTKAQLEHYMQGHILATGELVGSFNKNYK